MRFAKLSLEYPYPAPQIAIEWNKLLTLTNNYTTYIIFFFI